MCDDDAMNPPPEPSEQVIDESEQTYCYGHPDTPTKLRCSRCDRPICGRCAIPASVGQHCPECVAEAKRSAPRVRTVATATAPVVMGIIAVTVVFYVLQQVVGFRLTNALSAVPLYIDRGEWWRLLTPVLVHANLIHIAMNMLILYAYGSGAEQAFGSVRLVILYLISAFLGSALSFAFGSQDPLVGSVGASGAVFGVVGALVAFLYNRRTTQFVMDQLRGIGAFLLLNLVLGFLLPRIDVLAHIGGLVAGVIVGLAFDTPGARRRQLGRQALVAALVVGAGLLLVAYQMSQM